MFSNLFARQPIRSILRDLKSGVLSVDSNIHNSNTDVDQYTMTIIHAIDGAGAVKIVLQKRITYYWEFMRTSYHSPTDGWMTDDEIQTIYKAGLRQCKREKERILDIRRMELHNKLNPKKVK